MENPNYYIIIPASIRYDNRLKANEKLLYGELTTLSQKDGYSWAGNGYFADLYEVSKETVSRWLSNLQNCRYIKICIDQQAGNGRRILILPPVKDQDLLTKRLKGIEEKIKPPIDEKIKHNSTSIHYKKEQGTSVDFETFWKAYPKKKAKQDALKAFLKIVPSAGLLSAILKAVATQGSSPDWERENGKYIPYPATWLNGRRWEDEEKPPDKPQEITQDKPQEIPPELLWEKERHEENMQRFRTGECGWEELIPD